MSEVMQSDAVSEVAVTPIQVDVYAFEADGEVFFAHSWRRVGAPKGKKGRIEIDKGESQVPIMFHLHDKSGRHLAFLDVKDEPIWIDLNDCPTGWNKGGGQISNVKSSTKLLSVVDANIGNGCILHYALRFTGDASSEGPPYEYDPEIRNGGGGRVL
jgi:hypothetical protein